MGEHARIEPGGYVVIDVGRLARAAHRRPDEELTGDLHRWADTHPDPDRPATGRPRPAGTGRRPPGPGARTADSGWPRPELIAHVETRLDAEVWILPATAPELGPVAVVGINHDPPVVYADACPDSWDWFDADSLDITCPDGHGWTWRTGRELVTAGRSFTTLTAVFGPDLDAPFTPCPHCRAYQAGQRSKPCGCGGAPWIVCPVCGRRCDVDLPTW